MSDNYDQEICRAFAVLDEAIKRQRIRNETASTVPTPARTESHEDAPCQGDGET